MTGLAFQLAASLVAILALAALAQFLKLGGDVRLRDEGDARAIAGLAVSGFEPVEIILDRAGIGALLRDRHNRVMVIKRHGAHFAARLLTSHEDTRLDRNFLTIATGEKTFGSVTLDLGPQAQAWAGSLRRLGDAA